MPKMSSKVSRNSRWSRIHRPTSRQLEQSQRPRPKIRRKAPPENSRVAEPNESVEENYLDLGAELLNVPSMPLSKLCEVVDIGRQPEHISMQAEIVSACLQRILRDGDPESTKVPRTGQVDAMRRLVYCNGDVYLVAKTSWGKSLIFQAYSILTRYTTLQIVPMTKLGQEQFEGIQRLSATKPVLVTADNKKRNRDLLRDVAAGVYTHVLLGPEQACSREFREALKAPTFRDKIGLVAIDEAHFIRLWGGVFRTDYMSIYTLREALQQEVVWFTCTATAGAETQEAILKWSGLRSVGDGAFHTQIMRSSIDRPEIGLIRVKIPRRARRYTPLDFVLRDAVDDEGNASPQRVPKTLIFIDGKSKIRDCIIHMREQLIRMTQQATVKYSTNLRAGGMCVDNVVVEFTRHTAEYDKEARYREFLKPDSDIRVVVATTIFGTGLNVPDIERVILWTIPIGEQMEEAYQRIGRCARAIPQGIALVFLPYWLYDDEGSDTPDIVHTSGTQRVGRKARGRSRSSQVHPFQKESSESQQASQFQPSQSSGLRNEVSWDDDLDSITSSMLSRTDDACSVASNILARSDVQRRPWSIQEQRWRLKVGDVWLDAANNSCFGGVILASCGEPDAFTVRRPERCCNGPAHGCDALPLPPPVSTYEVPQKPRQPTGRADIALGRIDDWLSGVATSVYCVDDAQMPMPADAVMSKESRWELARLYNKTTRFVFRSSIDADYVCSHVPSLQDWHLLNEYGERLARFLYEIMQDVHDRGEALEHKRRESRQKTMPDQVPAAASPLPAGAHDTNETAMSLAVSRVIRTVSTPVPAPVREWADSMTNRQLPLTPPPSQTPNILRRMHTAYSHLRGVADLPKDGERPTPSTPSQKRPRTPLSEISANTRHSTRQRIVSPKMVDYQNNLRRGRA